MFLSQYSWFKRVNFCSMNFASVFYHIQLTRDFLKFPTYYCNPQRLVCKIPIIQDILPYFQHVIYSARSIYKFSCFALFFYFLFNSFKIKFLTFLYKCSWGLKQRGKKYQWDLKKQNYQNTLRCLLLLTKDNFKNKRMCKRNKNENFKLLNVTVNSALGQKGLLWWVLNRHS